MVTNNTLTIRSRRPPKRPLDLQFAAAYEIIRRCVGRHCGTAPRRQWRMVHPAAVGTRDRVKLPALSCVGGITSRLDSLTVTVPISHIEK
jgi:hypothetical protein